MIRIPTWFTTASFIAGCLLSGCSSPKASETSVVSGTVEVVIDFNGQRPNKEFPVSMTDGSTVLSILDRAQKAGEIKFEVRGQGETAFVTAIDGLKNEQANGDNWTYRVNGELGDRSCGVFNLKANDQILWLFGKYP